MRTHREHDGLSYESDIGQEIVTLIAHRYSVASRLGCLQDSILYFVVCKVRGWTRKEGGTRGAQFEEYGASIDIHAEEASAIVILL